MVRACCVTQCISGIKVPSHKFPKDPYRCLQWIKSLNLNHLETMTANQLQKYKVCHKHFVEKDYSNSLHNRFLLNTAIPMLQINDSDNSDNSIYATAKNIEEQNLQQLSDENENILSSQNLQLVVDKVNNLEKTVKQHSQQLLQQGQSLEQYNKEIESQNQEQKIDRGDTNEEMEESQLQQLHCKHANI